MAFAYTQYRTGAYCHEHWATTGYPLLSNKFNVTVNDTNVSTELVQLYQCTSNVSREVIYLFEVPPNAAVTGFTAQVGTTNIEADIRSKSEATTIYNQAKAGNVQAYKLDQVANDMFQISLGVVSPNTVFTLTVRYVQYVTSDTLDDSVRLVIPMTYGVTRAGTNPTFPSGWSGLTTTTAASSNAVEVNLRLRAQRQVMSLKSPTHTGLKSDIGFDYDAHLLSPRERERDQDLTRAWAQWISPSFPDKDLIITWQSPELDEPRAVMQRRTINGRTTYAFQLSLVSPVSLAVADGSDFIFMLDGAAAAPVNATIKEAFNTMTNYLPARPRVTVYKFTTNASVMVSRTTLDTGNALGVRNTVSAQLTPSGTKNIARSLSDVINARDKTVRECNIVIISDCQDWGVTETVQTITNAVAQATASGQLLRFFVFAVGDRVSNDMADSIVRAGMGGVVYAIDAKVDDLAYKARRLIKTVGMLPIQVRDVEWPFDEAQVAQPTGGGWGPKQDNDDGLGLKDKKDNIPPAPPMDKTPRPGNLLWSIRSTWNAIARGTPRAVLRVRIRYLTPGSTTENVQQFRVSNLGDYSPADVDLHILSAKALAQAAQDQLIFTTSADAKYDLEGYIERLGLTYRFATTQTSFIATTNGVAGHTIQPINFNNRSVGVTGANVNLSSLQVQRNAAASAPTASQFTANSSFAPPTAHFMRMAVSPSAGFVAASEPLRSEPVAPIAGTDIDAVNNEDEPKEVTIDSLLDMRTAQGGFPPNLITRDMFGGDLPPLPTTISSLNGDAFQKSELWVALLVVAYVKARLPNSRKRGDIEESAKKFFMTTLDCCFGLKEVERSNLLSSTLLDAEDAIP